MNTIELKSAAELAAEKAENLKAFSGLKLLHVKRELSLILSQIGKDGIFDEYTKHDISHIDYMLDSLDWLIPLQTKQIMTPADWLMITLAIYFHDLGMLVTKAEFENRQDSDFSRYKDSIMAGKYGLDYRDKIQSLQENNRQDRFIYQELVRHTHAQRIKSWILNEQHSSFSQQMKVADEIKNLISHLDPLFRRDLAIICESHHLDDLDDLDKYKTKQQYGPSKDEIVNLHYAALILRTADLLHVTSDRTPSVEFNLINPTDPISQDEWAKQRAVKTVRPKVKKNSEGNLDNSIQSDTLEIIAFFEDEKGFFGLISYLNYTSKQLRENFKFNELSIKQLGTQFSYPWKFIDDSNIETKDFEKKQFEFVLDQTRILDLLVGHTLYNDSTVVLRELTQNAIDATRLKTFEYKSSGKSNEYIPETTLSWAEETRELLITDNGTGMTLEIIQNHLLKVGSSRYQDEVFKKRFPDFSPISRFGIGLLTCFLIADDLDIITKSEESEKGILLKIRKVHGKYLLKYLSTDKLPADIQKHGTTIKLYVRAEIELKNIENDLRKWIMIPRCKINLKLNGNIITINQTSPSEALTNYLQEIGYEVDGKLIAVNEVHRDGVTMAFALRYIEYWKEWDFLDIRELDKENIAPVGTCIEGIRVDFNSPGFKGRKIYALVNASGKNAPKTNVARSNIEKTPESESLLYLIYQFFLEHITNQLNNLRKEGFSITWAASEANWLLNTFSLNARIGSNRDVKIDNPLLFDKALMDLQCILIEKQDKREITSINELKKLGHLWTVDCASYSSADSLIKEIKSSNTSALSLLKTIFGEEDSKTQHIDILLCNQQSDRLVDRLIIESFQVDSIKIIPEQRRIDLRWSVVTDKVWEEIIISEEETVRGTSLRCYVQIKDIEFENPIQEIAVNSSKGLFILKNSELNIYLAKLIKSLSNGTQEDKIALSKIASLLNNFFNFKYLDKGKIEEYIDSRLEREKDRNFSRLIWEKIDRNELLETISNTNFKKYDTTIWQRRHHFSLIN